MNIGVANMTTADGKRIFATGGGAPGRDAAVTLPLRAARPLSPPRRRRLPPAPSAAACRRLSDPTESSRLAANGAQPSLVAPRRIGDYLRLSSSTAFSARCSVPNESKSAPFRPNCWRAPRPATRAPSALLFRRHGPELRQWARGRLPRWARSVADTTDVVQDVLLRTFRRIDRFEDRGRGALRGYLRRSVMNRIHDEMRKVVRRPTGELEERLLQSARASSRRRSTRRWTPARAPLQGGARDAQRGRAHARGRPHRARVQLRPACPHRGRATPEAARQAVRRAVKKLAERMPRARGSR